MSLEIHGENFHARISSLKFAVDLNDVPNVYIVNAYIHLVRRINQVTVSF